MSSAPGRRGEHLAVAVVLASRDRPAMLAEALRATRAALAPDDEVVVVDSASRTSETAEVAAAAGVRCVRCPLPGLARARNAGVAATSADVVAFTDDDCRPHADWIDVVRAAFAPEEVGFVAGRVLAEDAAGSFTVSVKDDEVPRRFRGRVDASTVGHGANFAARRTTLEAVGGFDEALGAGSRFRAAEDIDFFHRALRAGWAGRFEPAATVGHLQWRDRGAAVRLQYGYGLGAGAFAAKAVRIDPRDGTRVLAAQLWRHGLRPLAHDLRQGYKTGIAMGVLRLSGTLAGAARGALVPLADTTFRP